MWRIAESNTKPQPIVKDMTCGTVYINKNIREITRKDHNDENEIIVYQYEQNKVDLKDWEVYEAMLNHTTEIGEIQEAVMELASIMVGE